MSRIFMNRRDVRSPEAAERAAFQAISEWRSVEMKNALGQHFGLTVRVGLRRPAWMPAWLYRRLLASVVTEERLERTR